MYNCTTCVPGSQSLRGFGSPRSGVTDDGEPPYECRELDLCPLQERQILTAEPSLQPSTCFFLHTAPLLGSSMDWFLWSSASRSMRSSCSEHKCPLSVFNSTDCQQSKAYQVKNTGGCIEGERWNAGGLLPAILAVLVEP